MQNKPTYDSIMELLKTALRVVPQKELDRYNKELEVIRADEEKIAEWKEEAKEELAAILPTLFTMYQLKVDILPLLLEVTEQGVAEIDEEMAEGREEEW